MKFWNQLTIKSRVIAIMVIVTAITAGAAFYQLNLSISELKNQKLTEMNIFAGKLDHSIQAQFYERYGDVQAFALNDALLMRSKNEISDILNSYSSLYGIYDLIIFTDTKGRLIASNTKSPDGKNINMEKLINHDYKNEVWFKAAMEAKWTSDKSKGFDNTFVEDAFIDPLVSSAYGENRWGNSFTTVVKNANGDIKGVITARAGFRWVESEFKALYKDAVSQNLSKIELNLVNKEGKSIVYYEPSVTKSEEVTHNYDELGKASLINSDGFEKNLLSKESDSGYSKDTEFHFDQIGSFKSISGDKMVDSIGWKVFLKVPTEQAFAAASAKTKFFFSFLAIQTILTLFIGISFASYLSAQLKKISLSISEGAHTISTNAQQVSTVSTQLSEAVSEQASSLQETVASVDEISAMISKNAESADQSKEKANDTRSVVQQGKQQVEQMIQSINEINVSNNEVNEQIQNSNRQISEIIQVIANISSKTKVITDIGFQTKLLSLNAAVEASRAGEHGKGFAVVAEEIESLAKLSGEAAKEIAELLEASSQKVEVIVKDTQARVEKLMDVGRRKVENGTVTAKKCGDALDSILTNVTNTLNLVTEIAVASKEQSLGVSEVTKAMSQLDQVTQQNSELAHETSTAAVAFKQQAQNLNHVVEELMSLVEKKNSKSVLANNEVTKSNVVSIHENKISAKKESTEIDNTLNQKAAAKYAVGSESVFPSANDPRFEDI